MEYALLGIICILNKLNQINDKSEKHKSLKKTNRLSNFLSVIGDMFSAIGNLFG